MSPIVCGTDFSPSSNLAVDAAVALAGLLGETLWLVHSVGLEEGWDDELRQAAFKKAQLRLQGAANAQASKHPIRTEVTWGAPVAGLLNFAKSQHASLLVVGSSSDAITPFFRTGGTSKRLAAEAELPVLVIRGADGFAGWARGEPMRVMVGIDETLSSGAALRWVETLRRAAPVDVVLGHVYYPDLVAAEFGLGRPAAMFTADRRTEEMLEKNLAQKIPSLAGTGALTHRVRLGLGRIGDHLVELAEAERCQLIVVGTHSRKGLSRMWSVSTAALHASRAAVAVVPPDGAAGRISQKPQLLRVLVTTDFSEAADAAVPWAYSLVAPRGEVTLAHVVLSEEAPGERESLELAAKLRAVPVEAGTKAVTRTEILHSHDPAKAIVEAAARLGSDIIVLSSHGRTGLKRAALGSVAEEVIRASSRPVFVVKVTE